MSTLKLVHRWLRAEARADSLLYALTAVSLHIGGDPHQPETVVKAAESVRTALNLHRGHSDIPRNADGAPVPFSVVGR